jgi:hypothetical protein
MEKVYKERKSKDRFVGAGSGSCCLQSKEFKEKRKNICLSVVLGREPRASRIATSYP